MPNFLSRIGHFLSYPLPEKFESVGDLYWSIKTRLYYGRYFYRIGFRSNIISPLRLVNISDIEIGDDVLIHKFAWLQTIHPSRSPRLRIGNGAVIGNFCHITCANSVSIGDNVLIADRVFISDHDHSYRDPAIPIKDQGITSRGQVSIGAGSWIGENAVIVSASIGQHCVVGSNSVVRSSIPDYSVAVGAPARIVHHFSVAEQEWRRV